ncbi:MAG: YibE/F family protein [Deltaproteobacteria bacterium]|nr:YibE/F family protein [Deltaproteobacteria bacterium]
MKKQINHRNDLAVAAILCIASLFLCYRPTGFEDRLTGQSTNCKGIVVAVDNSDVRQFGIVRMGAQSLKVALLGGAFKGRTVEALNEITGKMELDKFFRVGDKVFMVLSLKNGDIFYAHAQDHYRLGIELLLFSIFAGLLMFFGRWTGAKALLSFIFSGLMIWKVLLPLVLKGFDPIAVGLIVVCALTAVITILVGGWNRKGFVAFFGSFLGTATTYACALAFSREFHLHGAVKPFAETLLYSGFPALNLHRIFIAGIFMASSGALMDLAMDVSSSMEEVAVRDPSISFHELLNSGFRVGRTVVGTMTTTLLLAYSGGYMTLLMVFMAQGAPLVNLLNMNYMAAEILQTVVGSFGLVTVAPFTAIVGAYFFARGKRRNVAETGRLSRDRHRIEKTIDQLIDEGK